ncbi:MAG: aspartyl/glutamyl-tRNA(Asn/Gln) amidotransferase subunit, partial [Gemmatimonadota bacterium]
MSPGDAAGHWSDRWEIVVGLEVHCQLKTATKIFCDCPTSFGAPPNTHTCPVCLGLPGALPVLNEVAVRLAVRTALVLGCTVHRQSVFARKNYFYPDLPKGYQISQFDRPVATDGAVAVGGPGIEPGRVIRVHRVH